MSQRAPRLLVAMTLAFALLATACGGTATTDAPDTTQSASSSEDAAPAEAQASLVASTISGGQIDFGSLAGQDVVLWFWAPW